MEPTERMIVDTCHFLFLITVAAFGIVFWVRCLRQPTNNYLSSNFTKPFGLLDVMVGFLAWMFVPSLFVQLFMASLGVESFNDLTVVHRNLLSICHAAVQIAAVIAVMYWTVSKYGSAERVFGASLDSWQKTWPTTLRIFAMVVPILLILQFLLSQLVPYEHATLENLQDNFSWMTILTSWVGAALAAPICEEVFFRGILQGWLQRSGLGTNTGDPINEIAGGWPGDQPVWSKHVVPVESEIAEDSSKPPLNHFQWWWPIVASSALFAAAHSEQGLAPIALFFFGLALGFLYRSTGSILPAILLHFCLNAYSLFWLTIELAVNQWSAIG